ncbi:MAG: restriction endonuclease [Bauldia sp.]|uniref:BglII/BstYI family type II restriction endonuclease n=1 Tax=Bauldia sp. TaxID=2575872 RepID=UPI001DA6B41A|nr:BglII/BstYI family type II restriction endonuclease [Bauldia sp.]MCB1496022.1 restriction endonuclease [Bauldia sp.]
MSGLARTTFFKGWSCYDWRNAKTILEHAHSSEWNDVKNVLAGFRLRHSDLIAKGKGNKSAIAAAIDSKFYERGWKERKFETSVVVDKVSSDSPTHSVDCFKGKVALELEWNNKDPFYDRDLNNFRLLYDLRVADVGILVTRSTPLQQWLKTRHRELGKSKDTFGVSTTHFDKLEPRILGGGAGGCPVLVFAMEPDLYLDDRPAI